MLKKILLVIAALVVVLCVVVAMQPDSYRVERSKVIAAPAAVVFDQVADLKNFNNWNPWLELEENIEQIYGEQTAGVGASYEWKGQETGHGRMTIVQSDAPTTLKTRLDFLAPMPGTAASGFDLVPEGDGTKVTWWMNGTNDFVGKFFSLVMDMDEMIGTTYARGLDKLGAVSEAQAAGKATPPGAGDAGAE